MCFLAATAKTSYNSVRWDIDLNQSCTRLMAASRKGDLMDRKKLADEIRSAGNALRYADGPVIGGGWRGGKFRSLHSPMRKLKTPDALIIRMASTCSTCDASASKRDRETVEQMADCYQSFARLIWPCINHEPYCEAQPYIPVHEGAAKAISKAKEKLEARRKAKEAEKAANVTRGRNPRPERQEQQQKKSVALKKAAKKIASLEVELAAARKALRDQKRPVAKKAVRKKATQSRKKVKRKKKS